MAALKLLAPLVVLLMTATAVSGRMRSSRGGDRGGAGSRTRAPAPEAPAGGERLRVFILPHSHDDVGWVRTVDEYYDGFVSEIYSSVAEALRPSKDPTQRRKFQSVEQAYFSRWWQETATPPQREFVREYLQEGRWEFSVGGWVMPDEAVTDYADLMETMTLGHQWLNDTLGPAAVPRFGFQVDPFGASAVFAWHSALMGFDAHIISRINSWEKQKMQETQELEFVWRPSASLGGAAEIFTHVMDEFSYCSPFVSLEDQLDYLCAPPHNRTDCPGGGFYWDGDDSEVSQWWDARPAAPYPVVNHSNIEFYADYLVNNSVSRARWFKSPNLLWPWGCDFQHFNAVKMFASMDRLIDYVNQRNGPGERYDGIVLQYSTLTDYFTALHSTNITWAVRDSQDFLPYSTQTGSHGSKSWTGFYTSHSQLKGQVRRASAMLRTLDQIMAHNVMRERQISDATWGAAAQLRDAVGVLQHHDAVTGTEGAGQRTFAGEYEGQVGGVVHDYSSRLYGGTSSARHAIEASMDSLVVSVSDAAHAANDGGNGDDSGSQGSDSGSSGSDDADRPELEDGDTPFKFVAPGLSLSSKPFVQALNAELSTPVVAYNPLSWPVRRWLRVFVPRSDLAVRDEQGTLVLSQINAAHLAGAQPPPQPFSLYFFAELPALGYKSFTVEIGDAAEVGRTIPHDEIARQTNVTIGNEYFDLTFDGATGLLSALNLKLIQEGPRHMPFMADVMEYESFSNVTEGAVSGSYVFRPKGRAKTIRGHHHEIPTVPRISPTIGPYVQEVRQEFEPGVWVTYRIYSSSVAGNADAALGGFIEVETFIGTLKGNREVILRFSTDVSTEPRPASPNVTSVFYTDNNGQQTQRRAFNTTLWSAIPDEGTMIASNYRPLVRTAHIRDQGEIGGLSFGIVASRTHGCTSGGPGQLEVMLHRRALQDDGLGACFNWNNQNTTRPDGCPASLVPLNVTTSVDPSLWLVFDDAAPSSKLRHMLSQGVNNPPIVLFADVLSASHASGSDSFGATRWMTQFGATFKPIEYNALPINVQVLTLRPHHQNSSDLVMRLQHLYEIHDDNGLLSDSVRVSVGNMFVGIDVTDHEERSLSVVREAYEGLVDRWQWPTVLDQPQQTGEASLGNGDDDAGDDDDFNRFDDDGGTGSNSNSHGGDESGFHVHMTPQSVRTLLLTTTPHRDAPPGKHMPPGLLAGIVSASVIFAVFGGGLCWKVMDNKRVRRERAAMLGRGKHDDRDSLLHGQDRDSYGSLKLRTRSDSAGESEYRRRTSSTEGYAAGPLLPHAEDYR